MDTAIQAPVERSFAGIVAPIITAVFAVYLTMGMTLGLLPGFIKNDLKQDSLFVGIVIGLQSLATLLTRAYAGKLTDTRGAKASNRTGIGLILLAGGIYVAATGATGNPALAFALLLLARIVHGVSESLAVTGALAWGIGLVGLQRSGKVMTWNGIAMYAGIAIGAPVAIGLENVFGAGYVFAGIILLSVVSWLATLRLPALAVTEGHVRTPFYKVIHLIAGQGLGLAFASVGFACISSFIALLFAQRLWGEPSMAFMAFGACYVLTRVFCASFPDRFGGYRVALVSLSVEILGQLLIACSSSPAMVVVGCGVTGIGFSLIFPALGVLAIKKVSPQMRGTALGAYAAFFDLSLGLAGPAAGIIAGWYREQAVYLFGAVSCMLAIVALLWNRNKK
ncbi:MFS transporter [Taibaiella koreensis]|uniref:MFS transporter n=1 Tax=Taibaiella koreensis TaxID=1268548 RepID=UPI000E59E7AC|nr:MFS transporter [Taibaiella koreensis]